MKIDLHIDRLSIQGTDPTAKPEEIAAAIEAELERLSEAHGLPFDPESGGIDLGRVSLELDPGGTPAEIGARVARRLVSDWYRRSGSLVPGFDLDRPETIPARTGPPAPGPRKLDDGR